MRKPDKDYHKEEKKSSGKSRSEMAKKTAAKRAERRKRALEVLPIEEVARRLELVGEAGVRCPFCNQHGLELRDEQASFSCKSCNKKGNVLRLVKQARKLTDWQAIAHLEEMAANKSLSSRESTSTAPETTHLQPAPRPQHQPQRVSRQISPEEIERIKREVDLVQLAREEGVELKRQGQDFLGRCPFHDDKTPSLSISPAKNLWNCLGACGEGGSVIDWVMRTRRLTFLSAVEHLCERFPHLAGSSPLSTGSQPESRPEPIEPTPEQEIIAVQKALQMSISYYERSLKNSPPALSYLQKRGLSHPQLLETFRIGYCDRTLGSKLPYRKSPEGRELRRRLQRAGVVNERTGHEIFGGCLVFPIIDARGEITEVYGRKLDDRSRVTHLYLPGPHRGVFNYRGFIGGEVILCECVIDALTFWVNGLQNVTCSYGANGLSPDLRQALSRVRKVYLAYDADEAGDKAAETAAKELGAQGVECLRLEFPRGMDVNEFSRKKTHAESALKELLRQARPLGEKPSTREDIAPGPQKSPDTAKAKNATPGEMQVQKGEVEMAFDNRKYRVRGLFRNLSFDSLKVNIRVFEGDRFHVDTFDLYNARHRSQFIRTAALELSVKSDSIKRDIGRLLLRLEELQEQEIARVLHPKKQQVVLSESERRQAMELLQSPNLLRRITGDFSRCGLVGEETNVMLCYLALTSRKLDDPLAVIVQALSAAGKSALMSMALSFIPDEDVVRFTAMTGQSLFYLGEKDLVHKVLAISEEEGAEKASYAIKLLQSEKNLSIASTGKDMKSGRFVTHEYRVDGPTQIMLTTTAIEIDEELQNRCIIITVHESRKQTQAIHRRQRYGETLPGKLIEKEREHITRLHQNAQRLLRPLMVVNPYAEKLTFLDSRLRTRRDHVKYLTLIRSIALLHQYQRPVKKVMHHGQPVEYIEVTPEDIAVAGRLLSEILGMSLDDLAPQTRRFLEILVKMVDEHCERGKLPFEEYRFSRRTVREYSGWSDFQVRTHLNRLVDLEYVLLRSGNLGSRHVYELIYRDEGKQDTRFMLGLVDPSHLKKAQGEG